MHFRFLLLFLSLVYGITGTLYAYEDEISINRVNLPPYNSLDKKDVLSVESEMAIALITEAGYKVRFESYPWNRALKYLKKGLLEILPEMSKTKEREQYVEFLGISGYEQTVIIVRAENASARFKTLDDLLRPGYRFGIRQNFHYSDEFTYRLKNDKHFARHFRAVGREKVNMEDVERGRLFGAFSCLCGVRSYLKKDPSLSHHLSVIRVPFFQPEPVYFGVSKRINPKKMVRLKAAFKRLEEKKVFQQIMDKWVTAEEKVTIKQ